MTTNATVCLCRVTARSAAQHKSYTTRADRVIDRSTATSPGAVEVVDAEDEVRVLDEAGEVDAVAVEEVEADQATDPCLASSSCFNALGLHLSKSAWGVDRAGLKWSFCNDPSSWTVIASLFNKLKLSPFAWLEEGAILSRSRRISAPRGSRIPIVTASRLLQGACFCPAGKRCALVLRQSSDSRSSRAVGDCRPPWFAVYSVAHQSDCRMHLITALCDTTGAVPIASSVPQSAEH